MPGLDPGTTVVDLYEYFALWLFQCKLDALAPAHGANWCKPDRDERLCSDHHAERSVRASQLDLLPAFRRN